MRFLGQQIAQLIGAVSRPVAALAFRPPDASRPSVNPGRPQAAASSSGSDPVPKLVGLFAGVMGTLVGKIVAVLAPLAIVASAVASPTSGLGVLLSAMKILGSVLGAVLLPVFLALSALVYAVSGYIAQNLLPVLKDWYQAVVDGAIKAVELLEAAFVFAVRKVREFGEWLGKFDKDVKETGGDEPLGWISRNNPIRWFTGMTPDDIRGRRKAAEKGEAAPETEFGRILREIKERGTSQTGRPSPALGGLVGGLGAAAAPGGGATFADRFVDGLRKSMQEFRFQNAPPARFTTGGDIYKEAQLAAVNVSPFEKTAQDFMGKVLQVLGSIDKELRPAMVD